MTREERLSVTGSSRLVRSGNGAGLDRRDVIPGTGPHA